MIIFEDEEKGEKEEQRITYGRTDGVRMASFEIE